MAHTTLRQFATNLVDYYYDDECVANSENFDYVECPYYNEEWCYGRREDCINFVIENIKKMVDNTAEV
jgi:hypothetical protein